MPHEGLQDRLGADRPQGALQLTLFVPSVDRGGKGIDQKKWVEATLEVFGRLFRGATAFPPGLGVWRDDAQGGRLIFDDTVMVTSFLAPEELTVQAQVDLRGFLHRLGREARQGEVGIVVGGSYYGITRFDTEVPEEE
jgi:hypothetical protein